MAVAALHDGKWFRGEVVDLSNYDILVYFVDYGCKKNLKIENLRYLDKDHALPSRKACKGSIHGVKPKNGGALWSFEAIMQFMMKTKGKKLLATIKDEAEGVFMLSLIDDIAARTRVADFMVAEGFADRVLNIDYTKNAVLVRSFD